jgi:subtilisin family serine protease
MMAQPLRGTALQESKWGPTDWKAFQDTSGVGVNRPTGKGVRIGIIDSGCRIDHDEFQRRNPHGTSSRIILTRHFRNGINVKSADEKDVTDQTGHGTHVAGIAAGLNGVAPDAELVIARCDGAIPETALYEMATWMINEVDPIDYSSIFSPSLFSALYRAP